MKTKTSTYKPFSQYDFGCINILQDLKDLRSAGCNTARDLSSALNGLGVPLPAIATWSPADVVRALRSLKKLGLDDGRLRPAKSLALPSTKKRRKMEGSVDRLDCN